MSPRQGMGTLSALLTRYGGNSPVDSPHKGSVMKNLNELSNNSPIPDCFRQVTFTWHHDTRAIGPLWRESIGHRASIAGVNAFFGTSLTVRRDDLRRHDAHCDVTIIMLYSPSPDRDASYHTLPVALVTYVLPKIGILLPMVIYLMNYIMNSLGIFAFPIVWLDISYFTCGKNIKCIVLFENCAHSYCKYGSDVCLKYIFAQSYYYHAQMNSTINLNALH